MTYRLTERARRDALAIWVHIAEHDVRAADRFVNTLVQRFQILGKMPYAGRKRDELRSGYRSFPAGEYLIFYRITKLGVSIMHIVHGRRDLDRYLGD